MNLNFLVVLSVQSYLLGLFVILQTNVFFLRYLVFSFVFQTFDYLFVCLLFFFPFHIDFILLRFGTMF